MEQPNNKTELNADQSARRKLLVRVGLGSLPVLLTLKSKAAWGTSTLNCSLSENASQMQSVQPDKYQECKDTYDSHGSAKKYFELKESSDFKKNATAGGKGGFFYKTGESWDKYWGSVAIHQGTKFNDVFMYGYSGTLQEAVNQGGGVPLIRNIAAVFLHALYYEIRGISTNIPSPGQVVDAYLGAVTTQQQKQLAALLLYYIDGKA